MAARLNKKLVAGLTVLAMAALMVGSVAMIAQLRTTDPEIFLKQARERRTNKEFLAALKLYVQAYRVARPPDPLFLVEAGRMALELDNAEDAMTFWRKALEVDSGCEEAQKEIVNLRLELAPMMNTAPIWATVKDEADRLLEINEQSPLGHYCLGVSLIGLQSQDRANFEQGLAELETAVKLDPQNAEYARSLASQYEGLSPPRLEDADNVYKALIATNQENPTALRYYADFLGRRERKQEQLAHLQKAVEVAPDDPDNRVALGIFYAQEKDLDKAKAEFEQAIRMSPDSYAGYDALGRLYRRLSPPQPDKAIEVYEQRLQRPSERLGILGRRNRIARFMLLRDAVETLLEKTSAAGETAAAAMERAEQYLEQAVSEVGSDNLYSHVLRGRIRAKQGKLKEAINEFQSADEKSVVPNAEVKMHLAWLYYQDSQLGAAYKAVNQVLELQPRFAPGWVLLARLELDKGQHGQAMAFADRALQIFQASAAAGFPADAALEDEAWSLKAESLRRQGANAQAEEIIRQRAEARGTATTASDLVRMALLKKTQDPPDLPEAERLLQQALQLEPANLRVLQEMIGLYQNQGREQEAIALAEKAAAANPDDLNIQALAVYAREKDQEKIRQALHELIGREPDPFARAINYYSFYLGQRDLDNALKHLTEAEKLQPNDQIVVNGMFNLHLARDDWKAAETYAEKAGQLNLDGANGLFLMGQLFLAQREFDRAIEKLRSALKDHPANSRAYLWLGLALEQSRRTEEAFEAYRKAIEYNPNNGEAHLALARLAESLGNQALVDQHLAECQRLNVQHPWLEYKLQEKLEEKNPLEGITKREADREKNPQDVENLLRLAKLCLQVAIDKLRAEDVVGSNAYVDKCDQYGNEALALQPDDPRVVFEVSKFLRRSKQEAKAEEIIKSLIDRTTDPEQKARRKVMLALHHSELGAHVAENRAAADQAFEEAGALHPVRDVWYEIGNWYASTINYDVEGRLAKAVHWFNKSIGLNEDPTQDRRMRRRLLDVYLQSPFQAKATEEIQKAIDEYRNRYSDDPLGLLYQAEFDARQGNLEEALRGFTLYLERDPQNTLGFFRRGTIYFLQNRFTAAAEDLNRAKSLAPAAFGFEHRIRLARALELAGDSARAIAELRTILEEYPPERVERNQQMLGQINRVAAVLCDTLGRQQRWAEQETLIVQFMNRFPGSAEWAMRRGQNGEAQRDLVKALTGYDAAAKISGFQSQPTDSMLRVLNAMNQHSRVIQFVREELPKNKLTPLALMRVAHALLGLGQQQEAVAEYDQALAASARAFQLFSLIASDMKQKLGFETVVANCRKKVADNPKDTGTKFLLATYLMSEDMASTEAQSIFQEFYNSAQNDRERYFILQPLSTITYNRKDWEAAKKQYEEILRIQPDDPAALNNLAYLLAADLHRPAEALPYAERCVELLPDNASVWDTLGWIYVLQGKCRDGLSALSHAVELEADLLPASYHLAKAYICVKDRESAERQLRRARQLAEASKDEEYLKLVSEAMAEMGMAG